MILIVSSIEETAIQEVIAWLCYNEIPWCVVEHSTFERTINSIMINDDFDDLIINYDDQEVKMRDINFVWFRKTSLDKKYKFDQVAHKPVLHNRLLFHMSRELGGFKNSIYELLKISKKCLGDPNKNDINKLYSLFCAKKVGLKIPASIITSKKIHGKNFLNDHERIITKPIQDSLMVWQDDNSYALYTNTVEEFHFENGTDVFFPSLFQKEILKDYEIRVFFLNDECYSMAIFSQSDEKTQTDFRDYNWQKMNRMVPYMLPEDIKDKLVAFMNEVNLGTGSIDLIKSRDGDYVFLEVNPVGQFGFVSDHCNYYLEKKMSTYLSNYAN